MVFAAISGSSPVTVIAIGSIMVPALMDSRYDEHFSIGLMTSAGSLGILIPPSIPMIIYAVVCFQQRGLVSRFTESQPNMGDLFVAGILPGILIGTLLMLWSIFKARDKVMSIDDTVKQIPRTFIRGIWAAGLPLLIIGGIYSGWFLATEAAAVSVVYALVVEFAIHPTIRWFAHRRGEQLDEPLFDLPISKLPKVLRDSAVIMGALLLIVVLAIAFNQFLVNAEVPKMAADWVASHVDSKLKFLIMVNIFLLLVGCLMDIISAILIVAPLLAPIAVGSYDIDPIHFGIIFIVNLEIGYLTPPLGLNLFVASTVFDRPILTVIRSVIPFTLLLLFALGIICSWEGLSGALLHPR
jgi:C4-dicarboxylate transporter DctM subunit